MQYTFDFSVALKALRAGKRVARSKWSGDIDFIFIVPGSEFRVNRFPLNKFFNEGDIVEYNSHIDAVRDGNHVGVYSVTQEDILADDWFDVDVH